MGEKILVADDDYLLRDLLKDILEKEEYEVIEAKDGIQALECFRQTKDLSLVILDIMMPGKNGMTVLQEIRKTSQIPVIMLTALSDTKSELEGFALRLCVQAVSCQGTAGKSTGSSHLQNIISEGWRLEKSRRTGSGFKRLPCSCGWKRGSFNK